MKSFSYPFFSLQAEINSTGELIIRINGEDISSNLTNINDSYTSMRVMLMRTTNDTVIASFQSSVAVEFSLRAGALSAVTKVPPEFNGTVVGLLGNFDGDETNDFIYRNGTIAEDTISDSEKHTVAQTC